MAVFNLKIFSVIELLHMSYLCIDFSKNGQSGGLDKCMQAIAF